jgi:hypothetical protein
MEGCSVQPLVRSGVYNCGPFDYSFVVDRSIKKGVLSGKVIESGWGIEGNWFLDREGP